MDGSVVCCYQTIMLIFLIIIISNVVSSLTLNMDASIIGKSRHLTVDKLLDFWHLSASKSNFQDYFGCFHIQATFLGTDASENWTVIEFMKYAKPHFMAGSAWTYVPISGSRKLVFVPSTSSAIESKSDFSYSQICTFDELLTSESFNITCRGSGSAIFDVSNNCWFILSYHLTFPIPNDISKPLCKLIDSFQKQKSMQLADQVANDLIAEFELEEKTKQMQMEKKGKPKKKK